MMGGKPEFMGLHQTRENAEADIEALRGTKMADGWKIEKIPFLGWAWSCQECFRRTESRL
jgi:hypothetical protein